MEDWRKGVIKKNNSRETGIVNLIGSRLCGFVFFNCFMLKKKQAAGLILAQIKNLFQNYFQHSKTPVAQHSGKPKSAAPVLHNPATNSMLSEQEIICG
jgi:hypothetical protein